GAGSGRALHDGADVAAYLTARLPATYAAMASACSELAERASGFVPKTMLDAGAGPGTASWAAVEQWPGIASIVMRDVHPALAGAAAELCKIGPGALRSSRIELGDMADIAARDPFDLVVAAYAFAELAQDRLAPTVETLWNACRGAILVVEPGTAAGFQR